jgi:tetratricopeptide (TPR) repeat protein/predicted Ser/Thr protein kinase
VSGLVSCLEQSTIVAYVRGQLDGAVRHEVVNHAAECDWCRRHLAAAADALIDSRELPDGNRHSQPVAPAIATELSDLQRGATVGRYLVLNQLGKGGLGVVYEAFDSDLDRKVALKLLRRDTGDRLTHQLRLSREAQAIARAAHPNVVAVYEVGHVGEQVFIAMELVDGVTLSRWAREQPRSWREILEVFFQAARGLASAHSAGLVHRDFKPDNVLIGRDGRVRVVDFGLARADGATAPLAGASASPSPLAVELTRTGALLGTPAYMPPEQLAGHAVDARSDQFSFCVALYEALYGERPFVAPTLEELAGQIACGVICPPPRRARVPSWLRPILLRGLSAEPARRFASMEALLAALAKDPARRRRSVVTAAAAAVLICAAGLGFRHQLTARAQLCKNAGEELAGFWDKPTRDAMRAAFAASGSPIAADAYGHVARTLDDYARNWTAMRIQACEASRVRGEQSAELLDLRTQCLAQRLAEVKTVRDLLLHVDSQRVAKSVVAAARLTPLDGCADVTLLRAPIPPPSADVAKQAQALREQLASVVTLRNAGRPAEARALLDRVVVDARRLGYAPVEAEALFRDATLENRPRDWKINERKLDDALAAAERGRHGEIMVQAWSALVFTLASESRFDEAERAARHAAALLDGIGGNRRLEGVLLNMRGLVEHYRGRLDAALPYLQQSLATRIEALGPNDPEVGMATNNLSNLLSEKGDQQAALAYAERSLATMQRLFGPAHPWLAPPLIAIANAQAGLDRPHEALQSARRALQIREAEGDRGDATVIALVAVARIESQLDDHPAAIDHLRRALAIASAMTSNGARQAYVQTCLSEALDRSGRFEEARQLALEAVAIEEKQLGANSALLHEPLEQLGRALLHLGKAAQAIPILQRALPLAEQTHGPRSAELTSILVLLADAHARSHHAEWRQLLERGDEILRSDTHSPRQQATLQLEWARLVVSREPERARALAAAARDGFAKADDAHDVAEAERFIAENAR